MSALNGKFFFREKAWFFFTYLEDPGIDGVGPPSQDAGSSPPGLHDIFRIGDRNRSTFMNATGIRRGDNRRYTPPKFNIAPEKWWLEDSFPIWKVTFQGPC